MVMRDMRPLLARGSQSRCRALDGFDPHSNQLAQQRTLFATLDAFYRATTELGVERQVTTCTLSDFGRTSPPTRRAAPTMPGAIIT